jgi:hypothetical protein
MVRTVTPSDDERPEPIGDYIVDRDSIPGTPVRTQVVRILHGILLIILAVVSLALFWVIGLSVGLL